MENPFRPGAGHQPPYLAGREEQQHEVRRLLRQNVITENLILTGLRGVGKTVLLETFRPLAQSEGWLWTGADFSESSSVSENTLALRLITDLSQITSSFALPIGEKIKIGFNAVPEKSYSRLSFNYLKDIYDSTPSLVSDKLKTIIELSWSIISSNNTRINGIVFAYDEAQNMEDHKPQQQYPLSILLEVFQSIQRKSIPFMLVLTGLPTLFSKLVETRTYAERMFHVIFLNQLTREDSRDAIVKPIENSQCPIGFKDNDIEKVIKFSCGYPYFIQYMCKEIFESWIMNILEEKVPSVLFDNIIHKLDMDFFQGRWANVTDRQREFLKVVASLKNCDEEFAVKEIVTQSAKMLERPFSASNANQILSSLIKSGIIFKNRFGKYSLAVPLLAQFIRRQHI